MNQGYYPEPKSSSAGLIIAIVVVLLLVVGGIIAAVVLMKPKSGTGSVDEIDVTKIPPPAADGISPTTSLGGLDFYSGGSGYVNGWTHTQALGFCAKRGSTPPTIAQFKSAVANGYHYPYHYVWLQQTGVFGRSTKDANGVWTANYANAIPTQKYSIVCKSLERMDAGPGFQGPEYGIDPSGLGRFDPY